jgi:hypothetical protein
VNIVRGRASDDGSFIEFRWNDVTIFTRPLSALAADTCFKEIPKVFISKKSIMTPRDIGFVPSHDGTHGLEDYGILRLSLFSTGAYLYN